jgi:pyruvate ferredoxin oxidoreductase delta subunit
MKQKHLPVSEINETSGWTEIAPGGEIIESGTSRMFNTGVWRTMIPSFLADKCNHCMLCVPVCPDSSIPVKDGKRLDFDFMHCKGCGICYKVCPFGAIEYKKEER